MTYYLPVTVAFQQIFHLASMSRTKANLAKLKQPLAKRWWLYNLMLLQVQLIIDKLSRMQESQIKKIAKDAPFFQPTKFKEFEADITSFKIPIKPKNISQLFLKSYGYGYFDEAEAPVQTQMKTNFLIYLQQALKQCTSLKTLKIQFNGYSIRDKSLLKIIRLIEDLIVRDNRDIETIWIHTRLLRDCDKTMVEQLLSLTDTLLRGKKFQQISLQISGWEFVSGPLPNKDFSELFGSFAHNIMPMADHNLKRLKIDISSLYMNQLQSYNFLKDAVPQDQLIESIQNSRFDERLHGNIKNSNLRQDRINQYREEIVKYLQCIDSKYAIEHPIPGKSKFISREPEYQKRKKEYIQKMIEKVSKEDLLKVFNQERSMPEQHKNALKQIRSNVDQEMDEQAKRIQQGQELIKTTNDIQRRIGEKFIKFPFDFVVAQRIQAFHKAIRAFVGELLERLTKLEEFELDMCHWNGNFQMGQLKKSLTKGFSQGGVKPVLNQASKILPRNLAPANEEEGNKLKCKFIM